MTYAEKIKELRELKRLSMNSFEKQVGLSQSTVSNWENGKYEPTKQKLNQVIAHFKLPQDYFLNCTFEKKEKAKNQDTFPKHVILHHTPKKEVKINHTTGLDTLKSDFIRQKDELRQKMERLEIEFSVLEKSIKAIDKLTVDIKNGAVVLDNK